MNSKQTCIRHNQAQAHQISTTKTKAFSNEELGLVRALFERLALLTPCQRVQAQNWGLYIGDTTMISFVTLYQQTGIKLGDSFSGYSHYYLLTPEQLRKKLFNPKQVCIKN